MSNLTEVKLLNVPIESDYIDTLYFESKAAQYNYFISKVKMSMSNCTYQRKDNVIRYPMEYDKVIGCNYVMYRNNAYPESDNVVRWYYAFIKDIRYINDGMTEIEIETDVIQTWLFDYNVKQSFVEREHVDSDNIGEHTYPEGLETGEYICNYKTKTGWPDETEIVVGVTEFELGSEWSSAGNRCYNGIYSGLQYFRFKFPDTDNKLRDFIASYQDGKANSIVTMFISPSFLTNYIGYTNIAIIPDTLNPVKLAINHSGTADYRKTIALSTATLDGYEPRNKKLKCFPYRYLLVSNNSGNAVSYNYEDFYTGSGSNKSVLSSPQFTIEGVLTPGTSIRMVPLNYKGISRNDDEGINMGKFPLVSWLNQVYSNWLAQNSRNIASTFAAGIGEIVTGYATAATGNVLPGLTTTIGGLNAIQGTLNTIYEHKLAPAQIEGNINSGDVVTGSKQNDFHFYEMTIKKEYAQLLDNYLDMFGYKVNTLKVPNKNHRARWWFTKTIDVNIDGDIPMTDLQKIKDCYNRGIRFWKDTSENFGVYDNLNTITTN